MTFGSQRSTEEEREMKLPAALLILELLWACDAHEQHEGSEAIANLRLDMERIISGLDRKISEVEHKVMVSICHGADASSIFAKSCRELDASESLPTQSMTSVETTTSQKTSVATVASTMVTAGNETVDSAEEVHPSPVPSQTDEEEDYVSPPSEPQGPKGFFDIFGWKSNETLPTPPKPDLDRQCPSDIGPLTACYDRRPILGCYCFILVQRNWWDAAKFCQSNAMQLVSIETVQEQLMLQGLIVNVRIRNANDFVRGLDFGWWTSGSDEANEGHWIWTGTGQPVADLGRGMPDDASTYNNGLLLYSDGFIWVDAVQNERAYSICEF